MTQEKLAAERQIIDALDGQIVQLLEQRMQAVAKIAALKGQSDRQVLDSERERKVLEQVAAKISEPAYRETICDTFSDIMKHSRAFQEKQLDGADQHD